MTEPVAINNVGPIIKPDPSRVVIRPFVLADPAAFFDKDHPRGQRIGNRIFSLDANQLRQEAERVVASLSERHRNIESVLLRRFDEIKDYFSNQNPISEAQKLLIGAYFSEEYSFEAAASFNPSIVLHPDQPTTEADTVRFIMSLRGIGEGHVSSISFRTGTWTAGHPVSLDPISGMASAPRIEWPQDDHEGTVFLHCGGSRTLSETILFPVRASQRQGLEDLRLVRFSDDDGIISYYGTYTAYNGMDAHSELLVVHDNFESFEMQKLRGSAAVSKGMALFPRLIDGRYAMLGRHDNENIWFLTSTDLYEWETATRILTPKWPWEFVQLGNCGSPIEIDEGWLVITHGVGAVRNYFIGACLLDKKNPAKVLGRTAEPFLKYNPMERDGYVPNVVYSCGSLVHKRILIIPYGIADYFTTFASVSLDTLLNAME